MDTLAEHLRTEGWRPGNQPVSVCLVAEDLDTTARAEAFLKVLAVHLPPECRLVKQAWTLNELLMPRLRNLAAGDAAASGWVVLSLHHTRELPAHASAWLTAMVEKRRDAGGALVALLEPPGSESSTALRDTLARAAAGARMRLLVHWATPAGDWAEA